MRSGRRAGSLAVAIALAGCARYAPLPLPETPLLAPGIASLRHDRPLPPYLDVETVARLAVLNNPDLKAIRIRHGVADAQLLQAGLLPNPQGSLSATPTLAGPGVTTAWNAGLTQDLRSLILRPSAERAAKAGLHQVDAQILWQEWQVVGQARLLAVQLIEENDTLGLLHELSALLTRRVARQQIVLDAGDATYAMLAPDLATLAGTQGQLRAAGRLQLQQRHQLAALLGLQPDAPLPLADKVELPPLDMQALRAALPGLPRRRPDLLALRWGYEAANQKLRTAILLQFPNVSFGASGGSDNSNVRGIGPQLTFELPIFDRGQGNIAIARTSRQQLRDEYAARIAAADGEVAARLDELDELGSQIEAALAALPAVRAASDAAARQDLAGLLDPQAQTDLLTARFTRESELVALEQIRLEQQVAVETLAGIGMTMTTTPAP